MKVTRVRDLATVCVIVGIAAFVIFSVAYGSFPRFSYFTGTTLGFLALVEFGLTFAVRPRLQRKPDTVAVNPVTAVRLLALAKASSLVGVGAVGAWLGLLGHVLPIRSTVTAAASDAWTALLGVVCAAALVAAGLWLENSCKAPKDPTEDERKTP
jgi:hypothetical protein